MDKTCSHLTEPFYLDSRGRYRDRKTHRYVRKGIIENFKNEIKFDENIPLSKQAREATQRHLLETVIEEGIDAENTADAWGHLIRVQTRIALDSEKGSKATSAAKFIGQAAGLMVDDEQKAIISKVILGQKLAQEILGLIEEQSSGEN
jgi:hypothetical protein